MITNNKKANHDYFIEEVYEAGIVLAGTEVKSVCQGGCSVKESFIKVKNGEAFIYKMHMRNFSKRDDTCVYAYLYRGKLCKGRNGSCSW